MAATSSVTFYILTLMMVVAIADAHIALQQRRFFNVMNYGAVADGMTDNSQAFLKAWDEACQWEGKSAVWIPKREFGLKSVVFKGPCNGEIAFLIKGGLKAPTDPNLFFTDHWLAFQYVDGLVVKGGGYLNGEGPSAWPFNDCFTNRQCKPLPFTMRFDFVNNSMVHHLRSINSKSGHINLFACNNMSISHLRISAPGSSPNTDGIHIGSSTNIRVSHSTIGTGDDCVAMVAGSQNVDISNVVCGPGHGFSIGSLGKGPVEEEEYVTGVNIRDCTLVGTQNGLRIKTWAPSSSGIAADFLFKNVQMRSVNNPIIIDQQYCPQANCDSNAHSLVQISNVTFNNIWGSSSSKVAVLLKCSQAVPCQNIDLVNINLFYSGPGGPATSDCSNVRGETYGTMIPHGCL